MQRYVKKLYTVKKIKWKFEIDISFFFEKFEHIYNFYVYNIESRGRNDHNDRPKVCAANLSSMRGTGGIDRLCFDRQSHLHSVLCIHNILISYELRCRPAVHVGTYFTQCFNIRVYNDALDQTSASLNIWHKNRDENHAPEKNGFFLIIFATVVRRCI